MGTYIQTAFIHEFSFAVPTTKLQGISLDEFKIKVAKTVVGSLDCFSYEARGSFLTWNLKSEARRKHLVPLLERYYADFYGKDSKDFVADCKPVISFLGGDPSDDDLTNRAEEEGFSTFYPSDDWYRFPTVNGLEVQVNVSCVSLSSEGKVLVEEMGKHLAFFERALRLAYGDNLN
ncbi:MAG TPA: hypothetical protein VHE34_13110 [Puia sp.]|uniref:hypothetical protein n=1 Tax=Puia sp. TaxID=2045100 RepID=UPI002B5FA194|nr:hypothetical protein [Puia sp.]HVU96162.1 hypothetical protein [Puia sp.]